MRLRMREDCATQVACKVQSTYTFARRRSTGANEGEIYNMPMERPKLAMTYGANRAEFGRSAILMDVCSTSNQPGWRLQARTCSRFQELVHIPWTIAWSAYHLSILSTTTNIRWRCSAFTPWKGQKAAARGWSAPSTRSRAPIVALSVSSWTKCRQMIHSPPPSRALISRRQEQRD